MATDGSNFTKDGDEVLGFNRGQRPEDDSERVFVLVDRPGQDKNVLISYKPSVPGARQPTRDHTEEFVDVESTQDLDIN